MGNVNLVTNPSFETNLTGWTFSNATATRDSTTVTPGTGSYSCKMVASVPGAPMTASYTLTGLSLGHSYTVSFYAKTQPASDPFSVITSVDGDNFHSQPITQQNYFQRRQFGFIATDFSAILRIQTEEGLSTGDTLWIDRVQAVEGPLAPYFDGDSPYSGWSGTAHASTSTCNAISATLAGNVTTDEVVVVNGLCLNTVAWNITSKTGRYNPATVRGDDLSFPGSNGKVFVPNKPIDSGTWSLSMFLLGQNVDGTIPVGRAQRAAFDYNYMQLLRQVVNNQAPVNVYAWQPNGSVRTTTATLIGASPDVTLMMGGRRAELVLAFEILPGVWSDFMSTTIAGTASSAWSNQSLSLPGLAGGTVSIYDSVITVTGPITNPRVTNSDTGTWVQYTGTVPSGQLWVVDASQWTSKVNGSSVLANTTHSGNARFVLIGPGDLNASPSVTLTGGSTSSVTNISVTATRKHWTA